MILWGESTLLTQGFPSQRATNTKRVYAMVTSFNETQVIFGADKSYRVTAIMWLWLSKALYFSYSYLHLAGFMTAIV